MFIRQEISGIPLDIDPCRPSFQGPGRSHGQRGVPGHARADRDEVRSPDHVKML
ncbi:hypothetical protein GDI1432 [Gluconacetobacter diazotrophicus PA1 5]|uniref:Uncharacterized protein n=1 Tax=Gluconacetobacter diazotrophicus (strain ATCC 49037 / DSM 5601 / CCUG 37298 / CIP 103539 / LMG 7603 / PAl5) TaxID=272568 RepID=A9HFK5_GLUDA|nr:hypothetical protein GDI1432 [Gluconacetobacter diazotrophicus PA1 5]